MSTELARREFTSEEVELVKLTICRGATDTELALFIQQCKRTGLDPFARQIHAVKRWDATAQREVMSIQTGIDGFRLIAERTGKYAGNDDPVFDVENAKNPGKATATVWKVVDGHRISFSRSARWSEFVQTKKDGTVTKFWARMPYLMLGKVAEALALRAAFPQELSGLYTSDEMDQADEDAAHEQLPQRAAPSADSWAECPKGMRTEQRKQLVGESEMLAAKTLEELRDAWKKARWDTPDEENELIDIKDTRKRELTEGEHSQRPTTSGTSAPTAERATASAATPSSRTYQSTDSLPIAPRSGPTPASVSDLLVSVADATGDDETQLINEVCLTAGVGNLDDMTPAQLLAADKWLRGQSAKSVATA